MTDTLDTQIRNMVGHSVIGKYYGVNFEGIAVSSRQHTINYREILTVQLTKEIDVLNLVRPIGTKLLISSDSIENSRYQPFENSVKLA